MEFLPCPRCGNNKPWFTGRSFLCSTKSCGYSAWIYGADEETLKNQWNSQVSRYEENKRKRELKKAGRCKCGKYVRRHGWNFCPNCGEKVVS